MSIKPVSLQEASPRSSLDPPATPEVRIITLAYSNAIDKIAPFLEKNPKLNLLTIKDHRLYSALHIACLNNQINICKLFLNHVKRLGASAEEIKIWIDSQTDEGFTALHFASFKGSMDIIQLLEQHNADIHCISNQGLSLIHIAAQGDQPVSIIYFQQKGLSIHEKDKKGSTPLHWSAFLGMENAVTCLTSWGALLNETDKDALLTPLHLAVLSGNTKVVRRLLIKGADPSLRNHEGKRAIDLAMENEYENIVQLLKEKGWFLRCLNIKPSLQKKKNKNSLSVFLMLYALILGSNIFFVFPFIKQIEWIIVFGVLLISVIVFFLFSWLTNPGYMKNKRKDGLLNLLINNNPHIVCPECSIVKPERSRHCEYCNACVSVYDHHCPWINNCVGARNHGYFVAFTLSTLLSMVFILAMGIYHLLVSDESYKYFPSIYPTHFPLYIIKEIICGLDIAMAAIFVVPLIALNTVQFGNIVSGMTTSERFGFNVSKDNLSQTLNQSLSAIGKDGSNSQQEIRVTKEKTHYIKNCLLMCCFNKENRKYNYKAVEFSKSNDFSVQFIT